MNDTESNQGYNGTSATIYYFLFNLMKSMNRILLVACLSVLGIYTGCSRPASSSPQPAGDDKERVSLMLNWYPEAEHGGFYAAKVHGIFDQFGLDVEIRPGGPAAPVA